MQPSEGDEWWNNIWDYSTTFNAPLECDVTADAEDGPFGNYGLTVSGEEQTVSLCAGTCDETCDSGVVCGTGDSNQDGGVDVLDVVLVVDFVLVQVTERMTLSPLVHTHHIFTHTYAHAPVIVDCEVIAHARILVAHVLAVDVKELGARVDYLREGKQYV